MAICKYCKEEVKDDAIKCKHCGEWLQSKDKSLSFEFIGKLASDSISKLKEIKEDRYGKKEIEVPTETSPLILEGFQLYPEHFFFNDAKFSYNQITRLTNRYEESTINFNTTRYCRVGICFDYLPINKQKWLLEFNDSRYSLKNLRMCRNIGVYFAYKSYDTRLEFYMKELNETGKICYEDNIIIHKNGFISKGDKKLNLNTAAKNNLLWIGVEKGFGHTGSTNPYEINIKEQKGVFQPKIKFEANLDFDVISHIIQSLITI